EFGAVPVAGSDSAVHHPAPLGDLAVSLESEPFEQALRARVEVGTALRWSIIDLLGVGLHQSAASFLDGSQRTGHPSLGYSAATVPLASEDATDPPVRQRDEFLVVP